METKIIYASSPEGLNSKMEDMIAEGWLSVGSHSVVNTHSQNRYSGSQHMDTIHKTEYSITMQKIIYLLSSFSMKLRQMQNRL